MTSAAKDLLDVFCDIIGKIEEASEIYDMVADSIYTASVAILGHDNSISSGLNLTERVVRDNNERLNKLCQKVFKVKGTYQIAFERTANKVAACEWEHRRFEKLQERIYKSDDPDENLRLLERFANNLLGEGSEDHEE